MWWKNRKIERGFIGVKLGDALACFAVMVAPLVVENLRKRYGDLCAVENVSFTANEGEIVGLLGPNGAGKTSTLECIIGLRRPDAGAVRVCGIDALAHPQQVKERIGAQLQSTALQDKITPREALGLFSSFYSKPAFVDSLIERFSLAEKADAPFDSLSGGQRQRLALALAFVNEPQVIFLDEPTSGLDPQSRRELHESIRRLKGEGKTILLTTHYIEEAHELCDRVAIIDRGKIVASGTPDALIAAAKALPAIRLKVDRGVEATSLRALPGVREVDWTNDSGTLRTESIGPTLMVLVQFLEARQVQIVDLQLRRPTLEDVFIELTGSALRD
jgi:ABC-2 type transport system ATP-binding protein